MGADGGVKGGMCKGRSGCDTSGLRREGGGLSTHDKTPKVAIS